MASGAALEAPADQLDSMLCLGIDAGVDRLKACVLDRELNVVWTEKVEIDLELPEYGTRDGVHTVGDRVTCPSIVRLHALDLLFTKLSCDCPDPALLGRIRCISGCGQPNALHYLAPAFSPALRGMPLAPHLSLTELLTPTSPLEPVFSVPAPATDGDASTVEHLRALEEYFAQEELDTSPAPRADDFGRLAAVASSRRTQDVLEAGREELVRRTGGRPCLRSPVAQLIKTVQDRADRPEEVVEGGATGPIFEETERIVLESGLLASVFLGRLAPPDASDACTTGMFDPRRLEWDRDILSFVVGGGGEAEVDKLEARLGTVANGGDKPLGTISSYFVKRFGFSPNCLIVPFTGAEAATALAFPPDSRAGDVLISLCGVAETDSLIGPVKPGSYPTSQDWTLLLNPARAARLQGQDFASAAPSPFSQHDDGEEEGDDDDEPAFFAVVQNRDAGIGRALIRDLYCNGDWGVYTHLSAISPHGGTLGLDEKYFAYFFPHREASLAQGFLRFIAGARVQEFSDRNINPRLLLESQSMTLRIGLGRLLRAMQPAAETARDGIRPFNAVGFAPLSSASKPKRLIVVGEAASNPSLVMTLSTTFSAPAYVPAVLAKGRSSDELAASELGKGAFGSPASPGAAALGTAYKAAWTYERATTGLRISYKRFLLAAIKAQTERSEAEGRAGEHPQTGSGLPSLAGTFASSSVSGPPPSLLSLGGPDRSHLSSSSFAPVLEETSSPHPYKLVYGEEGLGSVEAERQLRDLGPDPPGLELVAVPDPDEHKYYASMLPEFVRLRRCALRGVI